jgi:hypothetical protein
MAQDITHSTAALHTKQLQNIDLKRSVLVKLGTRNSERNNPIVGK